ncbi:hypothetical protein Acsp06_25940 [Actinomycetospora sp. NBRC 106375]|uniref:DUF7455 domain-containing protein n=1 Tax=Actinomycetospora sp. NBRC 106375 TaxID=3032207 RepID=UPI0024A2E639|nr:hypothetical protein [Actinomycetospora sp. NBRC 106375]GLZ46409.1 hypothetical protein Acsp06_25940 [Actinomycetospora sp. NBRC 106375]
MTEPRTPNQTTPERCDACSARATHLAVLPGGGELVFCTHHHRAHRERLYVTGAWTGRLPSAVVPVDTVRPRNARAA